MDATQKKGRSRAARLAWFYCCAITVVCTLLLPCCKGAGSGVVTAPKSSTSVSIQRDTMVRILIDMHLAEAMIQSVRRDRDTTVKATIQDYYNIIYQTHHVTGQQFKEAFAYYSQDIETLDKMYDDMQILLSKMEEEAKVK